MCGWRERGGKIGKEVEAKVHRAFYAESRHLDTISSVMIFCEPVVSTLAVRMTELGKFFKYLWFLSLTMHTNV